MTKKSYPLLFDNLVEFPKPDDPSALPDIDYEQWLNAIADRAQDILDNWSEDWDTAAATPAGAALKEARKALHAIDQGDIQWALHSAYNVGREVERANRAFPINAYLTLVGASENGANRGKKKQQEIAAQRKEKVLEEYHGLSKTMNSRNIVSKIVSNLQGTEYQLGRDRIIEILESEGLR